MVRFINSIMKTTLYIEQILLYPRKKRAKLCTKKKKKKRAKLIIVVHHNTLDPIEIKIPKTSYIKYKASVRKGPQTTKQQSLLRNNKT